MTRITRLQHYFRERQLLLALTLAVLVALIMTGVSLKFYSMSDVSRLDLSQPGHEKTRSDVVTTDSNIKFDAIGPVDKSSLEAFQKLFDKNRTALNALGKFDTDALGDQQLKIDGNE